MKLLITDMDGTVVDSMDFLRELAVSLVAADDHSEARMRTLYQETFGKPISAQFQEWNRRYYEGDETVDVDKMTRLYERVHALAAPNFPLTDFGRALRNYRAKDWQFALVSSTHSRIIHLMPQLGTIKWKFIGGFQGQGTEKIHQIIRCVQELGFSLDNVVYVGDAPTDKEVAQSLNIPYHYPNGLLLDELCGQTPFKGI